MLEDGGGTERPLGFGARSWGNLLGGATMGAFKGAGSGLPGRIAGGGVGTGCCSHARFGGGGGKPAAFAVSTTGDVVFTSVLGVRTTAGGDEGFFSVTSCGAPGSLGPAGSKRAGTTGFGVSLTVLTETSSALWDPCWYLCQAERVGGGWEVARD